MNPPSTKTSMASCATTTNDNNLLSFNDAPSTPPFPSSSSYSFLKRHNSSDNPTFHRQRHISSSSSSSTPLSIHDFRLIRRIGSGDIGTVYLCHLHSGPNTGHEYAMKVVDRDALARKNKTHRAETEIKILKLLDHPFLPTLHAEFEASRYSCIVMEFCPGGDLHSLRHRQPAKRFPLHSARFYAAEVLVALEYLHMLGIIYRDLKPENVLVRSDGHIMLSDFDLSLCCDSIPAVQWPPLLTSCSTPDSSNTLPPRHKSPFSCLPSHLFRPKKIQTLTATKQFVAEPVTARSCSFVGTHEYVAPEVASGKSHGNAVDWWALGIFIYEMMYGRTPFVGVSNEDTLRNILKMPLEFPGFGMIGGGSGWGLEAQARDMISKLLDKDPEKRLGSKCGAVEVKTHPFFKGLNFALVRCMKPPAVPYLRRQSAPSTAATSPKVMVGGFRRKKSVSGLFEYF